MEKTIVLNTISQGWKDLTTDSSIYKLAWTQIISSLTGRWGVGTLDSVEGSIGSWTVQKNNMSFRINITPTSTGTKTFTLPFTPKSTFICFLQGTSLATTLVSSNIISLSLTQGISYTIEGHNVSL